MVQPHQKYYKGIMLDKFEPNIGKLSRREPEGGKQEILEKRPEERMKIMEMPEIVIRPERDTNLMSVMMKGCNPEWGNREHELAKLTERYFTEHPLDQKIKDVIRELQKRGTDEESLYYLSLAHQHPERAEAAFNVLRRHKEIENPEEAQQKLAEAFNLFDSEQFFRELGDKFTEYTKEDIRERERCLAESEKRIKKLIGFFQPKAQTTEIEKVNLLPTDFLYHKRSGKSFGLGKELIVMAPPEDSIDGQAHEFLHGVINPIVDKLDKNLSEDHKSKIIKLASGKIKQHYGEENYYSHLCEGFIRTYLNIFEKGRKPQTLKNFQELISQNIPDEKQFQEILAKDKELKQRCEVLNISSPEELSGRYFDIYERDRLGETLYRFYQDYKKESSEKPELTFEDFVLQKFTEHLDNYEIENPPAKETLEILQRRKENLLATLRAIEGEPTEQAGDLIKRHQDKKRFWELDFPEIKRAFWERERRAAEAFPPKTAATQTRLFEGLSPLKGEIFDGFRMGEDSLMKRTIDIIEGVPFAEVVVDRKADKNLSILCEWAKALKKEVPDEEERIFHIAQKVFKKMGGVDYEKIEEETTKNMEARKPILLGEINFGVCRHRALLFQILAVEAGLSPSLMVACVRAETEVIRSLHAYNEVDLKNGEVVVVDVMIPFFEEKKKKKFGDLTYEGFKKEGGFPRFGSNNLVFTEYLSGDKEQSLWGGRLGARALRQLLDVNLEAI